MISDMVVVQNTFLYEIVGNQEFITGACSHHQAISRLGDDLKINCNDKFGFLSIIQLIIINFYIGLCHVTY